MSVNRETLCYSCRRCCCSPPSCCRCSCSCCPRCCCCSSSSSSSSCSSCSCCRRRCCPHLSSPVALLGRRGERHSTIASVRPKFLNHFRVLTRLVCKSTGLKHLLCDRFCGIKRARRLSENTCLFEFSLCLSRACFGKMIVFMYKWLKRRVFRTGSGE